MSKGTRFRRIKSIKNRGEYNEGLLRRYDIPLWVDAEVFAKPRRAAGQRGRGQAYSDTLIEAGMTLKALFKLPYRGMQGMMQGIVKLMGRSDKVPDYSTLNRRSSGLQVRRDPTRRAHAIDLVPDTTGLKVYGEGEWKVRRHGWSKRRIWRKLHLSVDAHTQEIIVSDLTEHSVGDQEHLPAMMGGVPEDVKVRRVFADGIYGTHDCYDAVARRGATLITPPRKNAVLPPPDTPPHPRRKTIRDCRRWGRKRWKKRRHYHRRSLAETAMYRFKTTFGAPLAARQMHYQKAEAAIKVKTLNRLRKLAAPDYA